MSKVSGTFFLFGNCVLSVLPKLIFIKASDGQSPPHRCSGRRGLLSILCRLMADVMLVTFFSLQYYIPWSWKIIKVTLRPDWGSSLNCAWSCTKFRQRGANCFVKVRHLNFDHFKVLQPPAKPVPFFSRSSHHRVTDYYKGDVFRVNNRFQT